MDSFDDDESIKPQKDIPAIWKTSSVWEYVILILSIAVILVFLIPNDDDKIMNYTLSLASYASVILFVYYWSLVKPMRDHRIMLIFFVFVFMLSQIFHYYTDNNVVDIVMYSISLCILLYIIGRGITSPMVIIILIPLGYLIYLLTIQIICMS